MATDPSLPSFRLRPPPLPGQLLARPQVRNSILATPPAGTCVLSAAPGYGATTAVVQALTGTSEDVCWVSLDEAVSDEQARALFAAAVGCRGAEVEDVVDALAVAGASWVVVDGLNPQAHPGLMRTLAALVDHLPPAARLVVTSHHDLGWAQAMTWDEALLEFSEDESLDLLSMIAGDIHIDQAMEVMKVAAGWVFALVASCGTLRVGPGADRRHTALAAELLGPWFKQLTSQDKEFLEQTSILDLLAEGPAKAITGGVDVFARLMGLQYGHRYVRACPAPQGHSGRWWQRHPLLTALLRQRASGQDFMRAHAAAASWYAQTPDAHSAMRHMLAAGQYAEAAAYLEGHESRLLSTGQAPQVRQWYDELAEVRIHEIDAMVRGAWALILTRDIVGADAEFARLRAALAAQRATADATLRDEQLLARWAGEEALLEAYLAAFRGDPATVVAAARRAMEAPELEQLADLAQLAPILVTRGLLWAGRADDAERFLAGRPSHPGVNPVMRQAHLAGALALTDCAQGRVLAAQSRVSAIEAWSESTGIDSRALQIYAPTLARAWMLAELGSLDEAQALAGDLLQETAERGHLSDATWAALILGTVQVARGDYGAALRCVSQAREIATSRTPGSELLVPVAARQALIYMATGDFLRAERVIRQLPPGNAKLLLAARAGLHQQPTRARRMLEALDAQSPRVAAQRHLLLAASHLGSSRGVAKGHLREAAAVAHRNGLRLLLTPAVAGIADLASETALETDDEALQWLVAPLSTGVAVTGVQGGKLSRGELQLLSLLPTRAKNADIASQLGVSVNTVKTRLRRLYAKLGAGTRDEAIAAARSRGLLT